MSLSLTITLIAILDLAMVSALAWFMSHPRKLTPHISARHPGNHLSIVHREAQRAELQREERRAA